MNEKLQKAKRKVDELMSGRYGTDELERFLLVVWFVLLVASGCVSTFGGNSWVLLALTVLSLAVAVLVIFRFFSRKIFKRSEANTKYLRIKNGITEFFNLQRLKFKERKTHLYKKCPHCKKVMRLARVNGKHTVRCPMCGETFKVNIHGGTSSK